MVEPQYTEAQILGWFTKIQQNMSSEYYLDIIDLLKNLANATTNNNKDGIIENQNTLRTFNEAAIVNNCENELDNVIKAARNQPILVNSVLLSMYPELNPKESDDYHGV